MKTISIRTATAILVASCLSLTWTGTPVQAADKKEEKTIYKDARATIDSRVKDLLSRMTLEEKILQLSQYVLGNNDNINNIGETVKKFTGEEGSLIFVGTDPRLRNAMQKEAIENTRLGIPILFGFDVIHGFKTVFPIPLGQAASWNPDLVAQACRVAAREAEATGIDWTFSPMVDIARDGRWGRIAEGFGEDPYLCSVMSATSVKAYQGDDLSAEGSIAACLKHYVGYGASEAGRDYVPTEISRQTLWDTYLPSFEAGVKAGAATLMSSFNTISGTPASANHYTMTEVLKEKWGHTGFVVGDWNAVDQLITQGMAPDRKTATLYAFNAGLDMDMVDNCYRENLADLVSEGLVAQERLDDAVRRILRLKFMLGLFENPYTAETEAKERFLLPEYLETAEQLAQESMVLLKNDKNLLPLKKSSKIALIGPIVKNRFDMLGSWEGRGSEDDVISIYDGILASKEGEFEVNYAKGCDFDGEDTSGFPEAMAAASKSDVIVLCLGEKRAWSGENASRSTIALPEIQEQLLVELKKSGKPIAVLISSGRPVDLSRIAPMADAMLEIWQPGVMAGPATAGILSGKYNPSGKLAVTFPYSTGQIPIYYNHRNSGRTGAQGEYQDIQSTPMFEFGYGLSYTDFHYGPLTATLPGGRTASGTEDDAIEISSGQKFTAQITVTNTGDKDGKETVQWYICDPYCTITRPVKELKHFEKQMIKAGESRTFTFEIEPLRDLGFVNEDGERFLEKGDYYIMVQNQRIKIRII